MVTCACQGYCGGRVDLRDVRRVGPDGERFCPDCAEKWRKQREDD